MTESNRLTDLIARLRGEHGTEPWQVNPAAKIAADAIEAQAKRIAELEAALKPFANVTPVLQEDDHGVIYEWALNCDDIRQARKVLGEK